MLGAADRRMRGNLPKLGTLFRGLAGRSGGGEPESRPSDADARLIGDSGLFDLNRYLIDNADVLRAGLDPLRHFCVRGWREGLRPNLFFDPAWYANRHLGGSEAGVNPLAHYIRTGEAAGFRPICFFDPDWYRRAYDPPRGATALRHYLENRRSRPLAPNPDFDVAFYLDRHGAEIGPNRDPFGHLLRCGAARDLDPSAHFDSADYRRRFMPADLPPPASLADHERRVPLVHYLDRKA